MIVDDHAIIRRMVREVFEAENWEVLDAANGAEGVQKALKLGRATSHRESIYDTSGRNRSDSRSPR